MARFKKRKDPIEINLTSGITPEGHRSSGDDVSDRAEQSFEDRKLSFFDQVRRIDPELGKKFMKDVLMTSGNSLDEMIANFNQLCKLMAGLKFAEAEFKDFLEREVSTTSEEAEEEETETEDPWKEDSEDDYDPIYEAVEDFSEGSYDEGGMESFFRKSLKKSVDLLKDILTRLKRVEEKSELHDEKLNHLKEHYVKKPALELLDQKFKVLEGKIIRSDIAALDSNRAFSITLPEKPDVIEVKGVFPEEWDYMLKLSHARVNQLWVGPTGCGKSFLAEKLAEALGLEYYSISCTEGMSESEFKGWLLPLEDNMKFVYLPSGFVTAYEHGGVFNADEWDGVDPNVGIWVNKALAGNSFHLPLRKDNHLVKKHKDFVWIACGNTLGSGADMVYTGRNKLDGSTLDRHLNGLVTLDYSPIVEKAIVDKDIYMWAQYVRTAMTDLQMDGHPLSTRFMEVETLLRNMYPEDFSIENLQNKFFKNWDKDSIKRVKSRIQNMLTGSDTI